MAGQGERVLCLTVDPVALGDELRALAQADRPRVGHPRIDHPPAERRRVHLLVADGEPVLGLGHHPGGSAHRLHPARDHDRCVADGYGAGGLDDGLHSGAAQPVHRGAGHGDRQSGEQHGHPGHVTVVLARAVGVAEEHVVDAGRVELRCTGDEGGQYPGGEIVGTYAGQGSAVPADRGAYGIDDVHVAQTAGHVSSFVEASSTGAAVLCRMSS